MLKADVQIGSIYIARISGVLVPVRLDRPSPYGGWLATNMHSGRSIRIKSAAKLRRESTTSPTFGIIPAAAERRVVEGDGVETFISEDEENRFEFDDEGGLV